MEPLSCYKLLNLAES